MFFDGLAIFIFLYSFCILFIFLNFLKFKYLNLNILVILLYHESIWWYGFSFHEKFYFSYFFLCYSYFLQFNFGYGMAKWIITQIIVLRSIGLIIVAGDVLTIPIASEDSLTNIISFILSYLQASCCFFSSNNT